jgi:hypothetical protein
MFIDIAGVVLAGRVDWVCDAGSYYLVRYARATRTTLPYHA